MRLLLRKVPASCWYLSFLVHCWGGLAATAEDLPVVRETLIPSFVVDDDKAVEPLGVIGAIVEVGDHIAVLQGAEHKILLFSKDGEVAGDIGGRGQGPGDLSYPNFIVPLDQSRLAVGTYSVPGYLKSFELESGVELGKSRLVDRIMGLRYAEDVGYLIALTVTHNRIESATLKDSYRLRAAPVSRAMVHPDTLEFDVDCGIPLPTTTTEISGPRARLKEADFPLSTVPHRWTTTPSRVLAAPAFDKFKIVAWDLKRRRVETIEDTGYQAVSRTPEEMAWLEVHFQKSDVLLEGEEAAILGLWGRSDGELWVLPSRGVASDASRLTFTVYDEALTPKKVVELSFDVDLDRKMGIHPRRDLIELGATRIYIGTDNFPDYGYQGEAVQGPRVFAFDLPFSLRSATRRASFR